MPISSSSGGGDGGGVVTLLFSSSSSYNYHSSIIIITECKRVSTYFHQLMVQTMIIIDATDVGASYSILLASVEWWEKSCHSNHSDVIKCTHFRFLGCAPSASQQVRCVISVSFGLCEYPRNLSSTWSPRIALQTYSPDKPFVTKRQTSVFTKTFH